MLRSSTPTEAGPVSHPQRRRASPTKPSFIFIFKNFSVGTKLTHVAIVYFDGQILGCRQTINIQYKMTQIQSHKILTFTLVNVEMTMHGQRTRRLRGLSLALLVTGLRSRGHLFLAVLQIGKCLRILCLSYVAG